MSTFNSCGRVMLLLCSSCAFVVFPGVPGCVLDVHPTVRDALLGSWVSIEVRPTCAPFCPHLNPRCPPLISCCNVRSGGSNPLLSAISKKSHPGQTQSNLGQKDAQADHTPKVKQSPIAPKGTKADSPSLDPGPTGSTKLAHYEHKTSTMESDLELVAKQWPTLHDLTLVDGVVDICIWVPVVE